MFKSRWIRHIGWRIDHLVLVVGHERLELHRRYRRDDSHVKFTLQSLLHNFHMQHSQKPATETKTQGRRGLRLPNQGGVVELQFFHGRT